MTRSYGQNISRILDTTFRNYSGIVFMKNKPPLDSELNNISEVGAENLKELNKAHMPSGFLLDTSASEKDYNVDPNWSNLFTLGNTDADELHPALIAHVNGWTFPVCATKITTDADFRNVIKLNPPPSSGARIDFVFLEVWEALIKTTPSTVNKPAMNRLYKFGNVEFGGTQLTDDLTDSSLNLETTRRTQIQYRLRVYGSGSGSGSSVALDVYPDGLDDPTILAQGTAATPQAGFVFSNMKDALGDSGLWRAGDGVPTNSLNTVDGYVYAIPVCAIFRRNSSGFSALLSAGTPNHNGGFNRNPSASLLSNPRDGAKALTSATLTNDLSVSATGVIQLDGLLGSGIDDSLHAITSVNPLFLKIGGEIVRVTNVNAAALPGTITIDASNGRGRFKTENTFHEAGTSVSFYSVRPDDLFSDQIAFSDILDLRHAVTFDDWDYQTLLMHNLVGLLKGDLKTSYKESSSNAGSNSSQGLSVLEISYLQSNGATAPPNATIALDGPDGIRTVWSDAAVVQSDVTVLCDDQTPLSSGFTTNRLDQSSGWDYGADLQPSGFMNNLGGQGWTNGSSIFLYLGGTDGSSGPRTTFRDSATKAVRFVSPKEQWKKGFPEADPANGKQTPITLKFIESTIFETPGPGELAASRPGPMYPLEQYAFERPFIALGGLLHPNLHITGLTAATNLVNSTGYEIDLGIDFDLAGNFFPNETGDVSVDVESLDSSGVSYPLLRNTRTLFSLLTNNGSNRQGFDSEVYIVLYGDTGSTENNGVFKVVGAGTVGYTDVNASNSTSVAVVPVCYGISSSEGGTGVWDTASGATAIVAQFRCMEMNAEDGAASTSGTSAASAVVVLTDISGLTSADIPWSGRKKTEYLSEVTVAGVGPHTFNLPNTPVVAGSALIIVEINSGGLSFVNDDGAGNLTGSDLTSGTINYATGAVSMTFLVTDEPVVGENFEVYYEQVIATAVSGPVTEKLLINTSLLYHPGRASTAKVADSVLGVNLIGPSSTYLRQPRGVIDPTFASESGEPATESRFNPVNIQLWNRNSSLGLNMPFAPKYGGEIIANTEIDRENECFYDLGSKTLVFRPLQKKELVVVAHATESTPSLVNAVTFASPATDKDAANIFTANKTLGFAVPYEVMPRFGRQDIPYYVDTTGDGSGAFLEGFNHLFCDSKDATEPVFNIIGGDQNPGGTQVLRFLFTSQALAGYSQRTTIAGPGLDVSIARLCSYPSIVSSDFPEGLNGIELPPYHGIARLYGVYEYADFVDKGGDSFMADRVTPELDPATNLLRRDVNTRSLYIMRDGASDFTTENGDHTYIIPDNVLDLTKIPTYSPGDTFTSFNYVVECCVFGFAQNWINENNYVLVRNVDGEGNSITDAIPYELAGVNMVVPAPAQLNDAAYVAYKRTPYQGDPYMTRAGSTRTASDYTARYGQVATSDAYELNTPLPQVDGDGEFFVELPNLRSFEVLASADFYTTLGTGKISGATFAGTLTDVGYTENTAASASRKPVSPSANKYRVKTRTFTEGQESTENKARLRIQIQDTTGIEGLQIIITDPEGEKFVFTASTSNSVASGKFTVTSDPLVTAETLSTILLLKTFSSNFGKVIIPRYIKDTNTIELIAIPGGSEGNRISVEIKRGSSTGAFVLSKVVLLGLNNVTQTTLKNKTKMFLEGGFDLPKNGGSGFSAASLTGITEQLPLGILVQDSDFLCENPSKDDASSLVVLPTRYRSIQAAYPFTEGGAVEFSRFLGEPGSTFAMADGAILTYSAYPSGTRKFRLYRGGGAAYNLSGDYPGGPLDWVVEGLPKANQPVLKGAVLIGKAFLVRNFKETAFASNSVVSYGDEIQLVILTYAKLGNGNTTEEGVRLQGEISSTGYGEGYAAADRYRLRGRPLHHGRSRTVPNPAAVTPATYNEE